MLDIKFIIENKDQVQDGLNKKVMQNYKLG